MKSHPPDRALLIECFDKGFDGLVTPENLALLRGKYFPGTTAPPAAAPAASSAKDAGQTEKPQAEN